MEDIEDIDAVESTSPAYETFDQKESSGFEAGSPPPPKRPGSKAHGRKRTKTGCLTCRKRRIKCGEERPVCQNCTKSKRQCEGYNQRVVFKTPLNAYRPSLAATSLMSFPGSISNPLTPRHGEFFLQSSSGQKATPIAPKPSGMFRPTPHTCEPSSMSLPAIPSARFGHGMYGFSLGVINLPDQSLPPSLPSVPGFYTKPETTTRNPTQTPGSREYITAPDNLPPHDFDSLLLKGTSLNSPSRLPNLSSKQNAEPISDNASHTGAFQLRPTSHRNEPNLHLEVPDVRTYATQVTLNTNQPWPQQQQQQQQQLDAIEYDRDPFDVFDEDVEMEQTNEAGVWREAAHDDHLKNNDLGIVVALQANQDNHGVRLRSFTSFIDRPDMLATYVPSSQSSPLRDPMTARIFCHFVNVTAPCISMFERHPANPSLIFRGEPVPNTQQHIWTYTFPTLALQNPGLLHAMLAIASLHIAKLQNGPITASYKHYALSLRRVAKSVSLPSRRGHPATFAAALLLAFYECWSADHQKWSNHLLGARQLVREIDFARMTRYIKRRVAEDRDKSKQAGGYFEETRCQLHINEIDENIVGIMMGDQIKYDQYGHIVDEPRSKLDGDEEYTERDLEIYETQRDLFWWYCKQDTYQSILGGGRLFMDYSLWSHCPPRAPLGRLDAIYGTFDHLILLMGRLANFAAKDLKRKRLAIKMNGGCWQPLEAMRTPPQAYQYAPMQTTTAPLSPPILAFSGMVPDVKEATLPMGFESSRDNSPQSSTHSDDTDLLTQTREAEKEWHAIRNAFTMLENHFGEDFQALGPEFSAPIQTPFGPALQYRTFGIAGVWMNFYMGLISCYRAHPCMPPAAMMAAGVSAQQTACFANELGRIAAGVAPDCSMTNQVNPNIGAALIESCQPLFVSAVQYQYSAQRSWTICRLRDIARLTGWQSALAIVSGCETTWVKIGELGKGPPYTRTKEERVVPDIWSSSRRIDRAFDGKTVQERRLVIERSDRVHYAMGVISLDEDFEKLDLDTRRYDSSSCGTEPTW